MPWIPRMLNRASGRNAHFSLKNEQNSDLRNGFEGARYSIANQARLALSPDTLAHRTVCVLAFASTRPHCSFRFDGSQSEFWVCPVANGVARLNPPPTSLILYICGTDFLTARNDLTQTRFLSVDIQVHLYVFDWYSDECTLPTLRSGPEHDMP